VILDGLRRLEYRGYDSAGVAILNQGEFKRVRASGKLSELAKRLDGESFSGRIGIGHTRWATHGVPSERNAHPHMVEGVSLVHNGIIENYHEIKEQLRISGAEFSSDTDSELVAHLIAREVRSTKDLFQAVEQVIPKLRGAYSILAVWEKQPDTIVAFKNGPPLILGIAEDEVVIASDVQAIVAYTKDIVYLDDNEVARVQGATYQIFDEERKPLQKPVHRLNWDADAIEKSGFRHFMLKEIYEQPRAVAQAVAPHVDLESMQVRLRGVGFGSAFEKLEGLDLKADEKQTAEALRGIDRIFIVACGTSYYAAMVAEYLIETLARVPVEVDIASEFRYRDAVIPAKSLVIVISQSGETADTLAALRLAKQAGALTLSICNVRRSSIDREAQGHLYMNSGVEIGVASTKAFVSTLALANLLAIYLGKVRGQISEAQEKHFLQALLSVPSQMEAVLSYDKFFAEAAEDFKGYRGILYMGRGVHYPIAMEGALKLKELAYMHAEGYAAGEMKHGPLALIDDRMLIMMLAPSDRHYEKTVSNLEEARARGGHIVAVGTGENAELKKMSHHYLSLPEAEWTVTPILEAIPMQLLAYHVADSLGHDVDQPRNLAKSVTVE